MDINDIYLVQTCGACPEQYDAFIGTEKIGYLRLRHSNFRVDYLDCGGEVVFKHNFEYDGWKGCFSEDERDKYLNLAKEALLNKHLELV